MAYQYQYLPRTTNPHSHTEACARRESGITGRLSHRQETAQRAAILERWYTLNADTEAEAEAYAEAEAEAHARVRAYLASTSTLD